METSTALTQSMHNITTTKLAALSCQQQKFEAAKKRIIDAVASEQHRHGKVVLLLDAFEVHNIPVPANISVANARRFLDQSCHDPSVPPSLLQEWQESLEQALDVPSRMYNHASLIGSLAMEWLGNSNDLPITAAGSDDGQSFEHVGRKEMYDQRREWESIVFSAGSKSDPAAIATYLASIFDTTAKAKKLFKTPLEALRETMNSFNLDGFDTGNLKTCIVGVLKTDLLSEAKRKALVNFQNNPLVLREMADVLNMQIDALESWSWGDGAIPVEIRRSLNGKYRVYMDEEILQALLLHFIGMKIGVHMKKSFLAFFRSGAWQQSSRSSLDREARQRRQDFLGRESRHSQNVRNERRDRYQRDYFLSQLPSSFESMSDSYDDVGDAEKKKSTSPMDMKQSFLRLVSTEALMNTQLYGSLTILQSDFRWFGPSMPHTTIMAVLHFFGVSDHWLKFFEKFLEAPVRFAQDGPGAPTQIRRSGVPIQHRLSDALGEAVLFCLDFAVNKSTGSNLYRLHDDIWFWGPQDATVTAWQTIQRFAGVMGLKLNRWKTGAVKLSGETVAPREFSDSDALPTGSISWGFLKIGPLGKWMIDDAQVEAHGCELRLQLQACKSIFAWVQAWNIYVARFISNNFGEQANCLGRPHLDLVIHAFEKIQWQLFADDDLAGDNVVAHLRGKLARFGAEEVPDGFFYFPIELGGLGLVNPLIPLFLAHKGSLIDPTTVIDQAIAREEADYHEAKRLFTEEISLSRFDPAARANDVFMNLEEYTKYREETSYHLYRAYTKLLDGPRPSPLESTADVRNARLALPMELATQNDAYNEWVLQLYGPEIIRKYGGLAMGEKRLLPIGLASMLRSEKVRWQG